MLSVHVVSGLIFVILLPVIKIANGNYGRRASITFDRGFMTLNSQFWIVLTWCFHTDWR